MEVELPLCWNSLLLLKEFLPLVQLQCAFPSQLHIGGLHFNKYLGGRIGHSEMSRWAFSFRGWTYQNCEVKLQVISLHSYIIRLNYIELLVLNTHRSLWWCQILWFPSLPYLHFSQPDVRQLCGSLECERVWIKPSDFWRWNIATIAFDIGIVVNPVLKSLGPLTRFILFISIPTL